MPAWDGASDKVTIDYSQLSTKQDGEVPKKPQRTGCLSNKKGCVVRVLLLVVTVFVGLILGYVIRREVHPKITQKIMLQNGGNCTTQIKDYSPYTSKKLLGFLDAENIKEFVKKFTSTLDMAGTKGSLKKAGDVRGQFRSWQMDYVYNATYRVRLSYPGIQREPSDPSNLVQLINSSSSVVYTCKTSYNTPVSDHSSGNQDTSLTLNYIPYSPAGTAQGDLVYVNYGRPEDFQVLESKNISLTGNILLIRYKDGSPFIDWRKLHNSLQGKKVSGILFFADPQDFNYGGHSKLYPDTWWLPGNVTQFRTLSFTVGDLDTPFEPAKDYMLVQEDNKKSPTAFDQVAEFYPDIPLQPINYQDADYLLRQLTEGVPPDGWRGTLDTSYNLSKLKNSQKLNLTTFNEEVVKMIKNVLGVIVGREEPDRYVIIGAHHDSLVEGSITRGSGLGIAMELAQKFRELAHSGWKPRRSLIFAIWDATEFGAIGSTEWIEEYKLELSTSTVAYINLDAVIRGNIFTATGHPLLTEVLHAATRVVPSPDHDKTSVFDQWRKDSKKMEPGLYPYTASSVLLSCTDCTGFEMGVGAPSLQLGYTYPQEMKIKNFPVFQTYLDRFEYLHTFIDRNFTLHKAIAAVTADLVLRLVDSALLPFDLTDFVDAMWTAYNTTVLMHKETLTKDLMEAMNHFNKAIGDLSKAVALFQKQTKNITSLSSLELRQMNNKLMQVSRALAAPEIYSAGMNRKKTYMGMNILPVAIEESNGEPIFLNLHLQLLELESNLGTNGQPNNTDVLKTSFKKMAGIHTWKIKSLTTLFHNSVWPHEHDIETDS
ncbi:N-acetylated-alpha-linked acidic dipeptidase 2 [Lingula anatina]|uniref:N-acetylated-alpha-linked acidic dipeptidase 2 n=1 Tax=Lingula anatina TaxID=7574 RepID=A0A1S3HIR1_LINAN|nr:N-acetylated-alpha-linked acidic dipeptidase 2 [Lingula anatina]|eukprot:XP_013385897.1 N-acetylated-alpha-linked acidic dipeptidase 2 [Lingula anatina]